MNNEEIPKAVNEDRPGATSPSPSPRVGDLGAATGAQSEKDTVGPKLEEIPRSAPRVNDSWA
jgi:hypothetical protein